ncbi:hypothetical protein COLO4_30951 [Corchorus olitorius]|uniref:PGG domain-containing protein n=1 Tax=Corchorus olitorius TaxID=93759 RepID=A0A1R3H6C1_9ROSI|nr:hypothetical protein COLO4_30951 [Corchorus olitorius]
MLGRNPSIRACFPERFSDNDESGQNSRKSYTATSTPSDKSQPNSIGTTRFAAGQDLPLFNSKPFIQLTRTQSSVTELVKNASKLPLPEHARTLLVPQKPNDASKHVQMVDKFIPEPPSDATTPSSASILPTLVPTVGNDKTCTRLTLYAPLYQAALKGDWEKAKEFLNKHPGAANVRITKGWDTALHIAVGARHIGFVEEVVKLISVADLERRNKYNNTALCVAAASGVTRIAEAMVKKNKCLAGIRGNKGVTPLYIAALFGHRDMVWYLYKVTDADDLTREDYIGLLIATITTDLFDVALCLIQHHPELATMRDSNGETALHVLARKPSAFASKSELGTWEKFIYPWIYVEPLVKSGCLSSMSKSCCCNTNQVFISLGGKLRHAIEKTRHKAVYKKKLLHMEANVLVKLLWEQIFSLEDSHITEILRSPSQVLFAAAEFGVVELITELIQSYPDLIWKVDEHSRSIFHTAVIHRQEKIFSLIHDIGAHKDMIAAYKDKDNHCILHLAAKIAPPNRLNIVSGAALQMQRELLWFKEVEKNVHPLYREMRDIKGRTPRMLFAEEHTKLVKEGEKWMKSTASSCMLVATLITTVMFAAIFTVPGGNDNGKGTPIFLEAKSFIVFAVSDAFALFSSVTSILMFLSILTSRYAEEDFLRLLPQRLIVGLATLFFSITAMLVAFGATFCIVLSQRLAWIAVPAALFACIPVTLFAFLQFPLLVDMIQSSYGSGIFS